MRHDLRRVAMHLKPCQRIAEDAAVQKRTLRAGARGEIVQPALESDHLAQPFDVPPRER